MAFGLFWFAACFTSTFMTEAAQQGVKIDQVKTRVEADLNYLAQFDLGKDPLVEEYRITLEVKSGAAEKKIQELKDRALKGCMGMYTITHAIRLKAEVRKE
jgi:organic hydroperoxide reductase OsmC/OhrA